MNHLDQFVKTNSKIFNIQNKMHQKLDQLIDRTDKIINLSAEILEELQKEEYKNISEKEKQEKVKEVIVRFIKKDNQLNGDVSDDEVMNRFKSLIEEPTKLCNEIETLLEEIRLNKTISSQLTKLAGIEFIGLVTWTVFITGAGIAVEKILETGDWRESNLVYKDFINNPANIAETFTGFNSLDMKSWYKSTKVF